MKAIAVDDEPRALRVIELHLEKISFVELVKTFRDPTDALGWLGENSVDLIFLDVNMPNLSGLKFRDHIGKETMIIFTTAYAKYALESYELNALDYLVKPITFERFFKATLKAHDQFVLQKSRNPTPASDVSIITENSIYVKSGKLVHRLDESKILYVAKDGNYAFFHLRNQQKIIARLTMSQLLDLLPRDKFQRVHKSYVVALAHIDVFGRDSVKIGSIKIPVAKNYAPALMRHPLLHKE